MNSRRKRLAPSRLHAASSGPSAGSDSRLSIAQKALIMGISLEGEEPRLCSPTPPSQKKAKIVTETPGGRVETMPESTSVPLCANVLERVEALDLSEEEADDLLQQQPWHLKRWLVDDMLHQQPGHVKRWLIDHVDARECATSDPLNCAEASLADASDIVSVCINPSSSEGIPGIASVDVARPSTSGTSRPLNQAIGHLVRPISDAGSELDSDFDDEFDEPAIESNLDELGRDIPDNEVLEEPVRNIVVAIESAMDDEADRLVGESTTYDWKEDFESFRGVPEVFSGPTPGPLKDYATPYDAFTDIWSMDLIERIVQETNRYAKQTIEPMKAAGTLGRSSRLHKWVDTDADEIMVLFAVYMYMALDPRISQYEYWKSDDYLEMPKFRLLMTYNRYVLLSKFLHFVDNCDESQNSLQSGGVELSPKLAKIAPVISHLNTKFASLYNLQREIAIDESLTLFKGRLSWVQRINTKAARVFVKSYELCESQTGYLWKFQIYTDLQSTDLGGKTVKIVIDLLKDLNHLGHLLTMDNFYNSPALARYLKSLGFDCLGTLRPSRRNVPKEVSRASKWLPKGTIAARHSGDVSVLAWRHNKVVTMISTYHNDETFVSTSKARRKVVKPKSVADYNNTMGRIDVKDQKLAMYLLERKRGLKWYIKIFKRLLNTSIHNAFIMTVTSLRWRGKLPMTHREFRYALAKSVVEKHPRGKSNHRSLPPVPIPVAVPEVMRLRKDILHVPRVERKIRRNCIVCIGKGIRKSIASQCTTCQEHLCFEGCWLEWHSSTDLKERDSRGRKKRRFD